MGQRQRRIVALATPSCTDSDSVFSIRLLASASNTLEITLMHIEKFSKIKSF